MKIGVQYTPATLNGWRKTSINKQIAATNCRSDITSSTSPECRLFVIISTLFFRGFFMTASAPFTLAAHVQHLRYWVLIRTLVLICLAAAALFAYWRFYPSLATALPLKQIVFTLVLMTSINILTYFRLHNPLPVTPFEFFIHLLLDLLCLSVIFYFSGGANNPFVSYFLVPICISAATLTGFYTVIIASTGIISYSLLLFFHIPLPALAPSHEHMYHSLNLHVVGMWVNFFISAGLITYFVVKMAQALRAQEEQLNRLREDELRNEQLMAVATLAAGTAHELGTPLATMKVLLGELRAEYKDALPLTQDLELLSQQVEQCAATLRNLVDKAEQTKDGQFPRESVRHYCEKIIEHWRIIRPDVHATIDYAQHLPDITTLFHPTIEQAIINLLNNAADANPHNIEIHIHWNETQLTWKIADEGQGIPDDIAKQLGKNFISTKRKGLGIGVFLSQGTLNRYGGKVRLQRRQPRGTITEFFLPLHPEQ